MNPVTLNQPSDAQRLSQCHPSQICRILALTGDLASKLHLVNLGFHTNSRIKLHMIRHRTFIVTVDGSRFALDASLADQIQVQVSP
ncbi:MAG: FeoA family protein [Hydrogenovibrio sp.]